MLGYMNKSRQMFSYIYTYHFYCSNILVNTGKESVINSLTNGKYYIDHCAAIDNMRGTMEALLEASSPLIIARQLARWRWVDEDGGK